MGALEVLLIVLGLIVVIVFFFAVWYISTMNRLRRMNVKCDEAESGIDVALTKRFDLITKLVDTTKGYTKHERDTLTEVIKMRMPQANATLAEKQDAANKLTQAMNSINVVMERYPDLKADTHFKTLMNASSEVEEHLQAARRLYNANVSSLNQSIVSFPSSFVAAKIGLVKRDFFQVEEVKKADVKISF